MNSLGYRNGKFGKIHHKLYEKSKDFVEVDSFKEIIISQNMIHLKSKYN